MDAHVMLIEMLYMVHIKVRVLSKLHSIPHTALIDILYNTKGMAVLCSHKFDYFFYVIWLNRIASCFIASRCTAPLTPVDNLITFLSIAFNPYRLHQSMA
ncbi:hypothetical protein AMJ83_01465 [candidate division WOR_3 bacterium SM23_42]|uniref:Uncharacterized protein n=1 Tax=candidate division WOR_3 bacterium SM23_42 TaxID=1703779 RepID=A0A0S8FW13_UNCW3|nr:MAG: hypothetical protein AMJ83_01465 [candidate division WOR_3 bacterium SM23_42]